MWAGIYAFGVAAAACPFAVFCDPSREPRVVIVTVLGLVGGAPAPGGGGDTARRRFIGGCRFFHNVTSRTAAATRSARRGPTSASTPRQRATMPSAMARSRAASQKVHPPGPHRKN